MLGVPLQARLVTASGQSHNVTHELLQDVTFGSTIPGGYASCSLSLARALDMPAAELEAYSRVDLIDTRTAGTVWSGRLDSPGRSAGSSGQVYALTAVGAQAHSTDVTLPVIYNDARLDQWADISKDITPAAKVSTAQIGGVEGDANTRLMLELPRGTNMASQARAVAQYPHLLAAAQRLARLDVGMLGRRTEALLRGQIVGRASAGSAATAVLADVGMTTSEQLLNTTTSSVYYLPELRLFWNGAAGVTIGDDVSYFLARGLRMQGERVNADGTAVTAYPGPTVPTAEIVADVVGRFLPQFDGANASIAASTFAVDQLAYEDGTTARQVLEDLMLLDPGHYWAAWDVNDAGLAAFEWAPYSTVVSLDVDTVDGFDSPGSSADLFNEVVVRWVDLRGKTRQTTRTADSPPLTAAGIVRSHRLDLGSQAGSEAQATRAGDMFLEQHRLPSNNGTLRISRPVADVQSGRMLQPWEIKPGGLVRVRDIAPRQDALNPVGSDGVTVFRCAETSYSSADNTCTLTLDSFSWALERQIAGLVKQSARQLRK